MKKTFALLALTTIFFTMPDAEACRRYCGSSNGVRLAGDIIRLVDRGLTVLDRHACYCEPVPVTYVPAGAAVPVTAVPVTATPAAPTVVNVQYVYPHRRPAHYQTPGNIPPQRGLVYAH